LLRHKGFALRMLGCSPISDGCVLEDEGLRKEILSKTHHFPYTVHPGSIKMYKDEFALPLDLITLFSRLYLDCIPIPVLVEMIVVYKRICFPL
jgi:hypothetical protein